MFKSIRWKIAIDFLLLVMLAQIIGGTIAVIWISNYYRGEFSKTIDTVFNDDLKNELTEGANKLSGEQGEGGTIVITDAPADNADTIKSIMSYYPGVLGISSSRCYNILDSNGAVLFSSGNYTELELTPALVSALNGTESRETGITSSYMDYALPLMDGAQVRYVIYVNDNGEQRRGVLGALFRIIIWSALITGAAAFFLGNVLSTSVAVPLKQLTERAKSLADGDINALEESDAGDELGELTNSLVYLAHTRQESADKVESEKIKVETILQNMNDGILAFDMQGKLIHFNREAQRLINRQFMDDISFNSFFKEINADITLGDLLYIKPEQALEREIKLNDRFLRMNFAPFNSENKIGGIIVIIHDETRHQKLEASRRDFVADVSHELRTPLTIIKSYADILADSPDADKELRTRFLATISNETDRMTRIISDLLTLSKLDENQTYTKPPEEIDIRAMTEAIVERLQLTAKKKQQTLVYHPINDVPHVMGDRDGLERAVINIITNALKYTPTNGKIEVYTSKVYKDINIKVCDNGIGIPKDKLPNIFDRFFRVEKARNRGTGGTGLGLAIAKQTIETVFKGKIKITSEVNKGTEVVISIPADTFVKGE
ncbi:MAG: ATP-binding protein [Clostridiales bacterium]|nr:ATP-binding protein [Clostridiales bacterium]